MEKRSDSKNERSRSSSRMSSEYRLIVWWCLSAMMELTVTPQPQTKGFSFFHIGKTKKRDCSVIWTKKWKLCESIDQSSSSFPCVSWIASTVDTNITPNRDRVCKRRKTILPDAQTRVVSFRFRLKRVLLLACSSSSARLVSYAERLARATCSRMYGHFGLIPSRLYEWSISLWIMPDRYPIP